jgi:tetratricopeptide (TPR) repeat protein
MESGSPRGDAGHTAVAKDNAQQAVQYHGIQINTFIGAGSVSAVPPQVVDGLPRDVPCFVNRDNSLDQIREGRRASAPVYAIDGMPGVGKTSFAVHVAHSIASEYPDARLFIGLHSKDRHRVPIHPGAALSTLLRMLGVPSNEIPDTLDGRAALWRARLAPQRVLVIYDDAASSEQVEPLLTGSPGSLAIVTSRRRLARLDWIQRITLNPLTLADAEELFGRTLGPERAYDELEPVRAVARHCGCLPLAIKLVAARLRYRPVWSVADMATLLVEAEDRLGEIRAEGDEVATAFELSYRDLNPELRRFFRRLGLHPGPEFDEYAAAALLGVDLGLARRSLEELYDHNLLDQPRFGRYLLHDLIYSYAQGLARQDEDAAEAKEAIDRILNYYLAAGIAADRSINLLMRRREWTPAQSLATPSFTSHAQAMEWMEAERTNLHASIQLAVDADRPIMAARIAHAIAYFLRLKGYWNEMFDLCNLAKGLFVAASDRAGSADMSFYIGDIDRLTGRRPEALERYREAIIIYQELGDRHQEARALHSLGDVVRSARDYAEARRYYMAALAIYRELGNSLAEARAMHSLADNGRLSGHDHDDARSRYRQALEIYRRHNDQVGQVRVLHGIADLEIGFGSHEDALANCEAALDQYRRLGDRLGEADALSSIGKTHAAIAEVASAIRNFEAALDVYRSLGDLHGQAMTLRALAQLRDANGQSEMAQDLYDNAAQAWLNIKDLEMASRDWLAASKIIFAQGNREEAIGYLDRALEVASLQGDANSADLLRIQIAHYSTSD